MKTKIIAAFIAAAISFTAFADELDDKINAFGDQHREIAVMHYAGDGSHLLVYYQPGLKVGTAKLSEFCAILATRAKVDLYQWEDKYKLVTSWQCE